MNDVAHVQIVETVDQLESQSAHVFLGVPRQIVHVLQQIHALLVHATPTTHYKAPEKKAARRLKQY